MPKQIENPKKWLIVTTCVCAAWIGGCVTKRAPVKPPVNFIAAVKPIVPQGVAMGLEAPPEVEVEPLPAAPQIGPNHFQPARPRVAPSVQEHVEVEEHPEPMIAPEVPSEELKAAQAETQRNLDLAEKNLAQAQGKNLNAAQQDIVSKVKGFTDSARDAMKNGDWVRAKSLSSKAEALAEQLAGSF
jgi:hypothetical protein